MKKMITKIFWPILSMFETEEVGNYKRSHRVVLIVVGCLFCLLAAISAGAAFFTGNLGALFPAAVFVSVAFVTLVVGSLGSDNAVARIWKSR